MKITNPINSFTQLTPPNSSAKKIVDFPNEILTNIFGYFGTGDLVNVLLTCKKFKTIGSQDSLWKRFIKDGSKPQNDLDYHDFFMSNCKNEKMKSFFRSNPNVIIGQDVKDPTTGNNVKDPVEVKFKNQYPGLFTPIK